MSVKDEWKAANQRWVEFARQQEEKLYVDKLNAAKASLKKRYHLFKKPTYTATISVNTLTNQAFFILSFLFEDTYTKTWNHQPTDEEILDFIKTIYKPEWT